MIATNECCINSFHIKFIVCTQENIIYFNWLAFGPVHLSCQSPALANGIGGKLVG